MYLHAFHPNDITQCYGQEQFYAIVRVGTKYQVASLYHNDDKRKKGGRAHIGIEMVPHSTQNQDFVKRLPLHNHSPKILSIIY